MSHTGFERIVRFDTPANFGFDATKIEVDTVDAVARLIPPPSMLFAALYESLPADPTAVDADFSRDGGSLLPIAGVANTDGLGNLDFQFVCLVVGIDCLHLRA